MKRPIMTVFLASCLTVFVAGCASNPFYGGVYTQVSLRMGHLHAPLDAQKSVKV